MTEHEIDLTGVAHGGYAVGRLDGQVVFVSGGIPGERVRVTVIRAAKRYLFARVTGVVVASPDRVPHIWADADRRGVGGADLGHVSLPAQRRWKEQVLADALERVGRVQVAAPAVESLSDGSAGTRTRVRFVADDAGRPAMRRPRSHETVALTDMPLAVPEIRQLGIFLDRWRGAFSPGSEIAAVAPSNSEPVVVAGERAWRAPGRNAPRTVRERVTWNGGTFDFTVDALGFWQVHRAAPQRLVDEVMRAAQLTGGERVVELFSGAGLLTAPLASASGQVTAVELDRAAVAAARRNVPRGVQLVRAAVAPRHVPDDADVVVLDPPRSGAGSALTQRLREAAPGRIVYVACDPVALARDLGQLISHYEVTSLVALDMFEHTHHMEAVATLQLR